MSFTYTSNWTSQWIHFNPQRFRGGTEWGQVTGFPWLERKRADEKGRTLFSGPLGSLNSFLSFFKQNIA